MQKKKNKSYSDGVLEVKQGNACTLFNEASCRRQPLAGPLQNCCSLSCQNYAKDDAKVTWLQCAGRQSCVQEQSQRGLGHASRRRA